MLRIVEIDSQERAFSLRGLPLLAPLAPDSDNDEDYAEQDEPRKDEPDEEIGIRVDTPGERLNDRQEDDEAGVEDRYDQADK